MQLDWSLLGLDRTPDFGNIVRKGMAEGRETSRQYRQDNALAALAQRPDDDQAMAELAGINPEAAWKFGDRRKAAADDEQAKVQAQIKARQADILEGGKIVRQVQPKDQAGLDMVLGAARARGIDLEGVPTVWSAETGQYLAQLVTVADSLDPATSEWENKTTEAGGGLYQINKRTGEVKTVVQPNDGSQTMGTPVATGNLPTVTDAASYEAVPSGQQYRDKDGNVRTKTGGQAASPPGTFPSF